MHQARVSATVRPMRLSPLPAAASWSHRDVRTGFEVAFFHRQDGGHRLVGHTTAREGSASWSVGYDVTVDSAWRTLTVLATSVTAGGSRQVLLSRDTGDRWTVDGRRRPRLDGCTDVDLESSVVTNTLPVHRLTYVEGAVASVPAVFVRALDLRVERLEQTYTLTAMGDDGPSFHYTAARFGVECELTYDSSGLLREYPGIATRVPPPQRPPVE